MQVRQGRMFMGRFLYRGDLLESLTEVCRKENVCLGSFSVIGALTQVKLGFYNQEKKKYVTCVDLNKKLEITVCTGNVSTKDSDIFVHAHITLADHAGNCYGGHLMPGSLIFAAEYVINEFTGGVLKREFDPETGLALFNQHAENPGFSRFSSYRIDKGVTGSR